MILLLIAAGFCVSCLGALVGLGGGILLTPLLLFLPSLFGLDALSIHDITGLTMVQGVLGTASGAIGHGRAGFVSRRLVGVMGSSIAVGALIGAIGSRWVSGQILLLIFSGLAVLAAVLLLLPRREQPEGRVTFSARPAGGLAFAIGLGGGLVGQGGSFLVMPVLLRVLRIPTRVAIGSSLAIVLCGALAGLAGKTGTDQVTLALALALAAGSLPGAQVGAWLSRRTRPTVLRYVLAVLVIAAAIRISLQATLT